MGGGGEECVALWRRKGKIEKRGGGETRLKGQTGGRDKFTESKISNTFPFIFLKEKEGEPSQHYVTWRKGKRYPAPNGGRVGRSREERGPPSHPKGGERQESSLKNGEKGKKEKIF